MDKVSKVRKSRTKSKLEFLLSYCSFNIFTGTVLRALDQQQNVAKKVFWHVILEVFLITLRGGGPPPPPRGGLEILVGNFLIGCWEPKEAWFWPFGRFLKLKTFCKYWTSIEIKISMTCVYKEYEIKIKIIDEWWLQLKMKLHWVIAWRLLFSGGINLCCEGRNENLVGRFF